MQEALSTYRRRHGIAHLEFSYYRAPGVDCTLHLSPSCLNLRAHGRGADETAAFLDAIEEAERIVVPAQPPVVTILR